MHCTTRYTTAAAVLSRGDFVISNRLGWSVLSSCGTSCGPLYISRTETADRMPGVGVSWAAGGPILVDIRKNKRVPFIRGRHENIKEKRLISVSGVISRYLPALGSCSMHDTRFLLLSTILHRCCCAFRLMIHLIV